MHPQANPNLVGLETQVERVEFTGPCPACSVEVRWLGRYDKGGDGVYGSGGTVYDINGCGCVPSRS